MTRDDIIRWAQEAEFNSFAELWAPALERFATLVAEHVRLAQPMEPVAWMHTTGTGHVYFRKKPQDKVFNPQPVFTAPPKAAEWVGLTDEERRQILLDDPIDWIAAIEAKLKERNG